MGELEGKEAVDTLLCRLHGATEELKKGGLQLPEVIRIAQYIMLITREWETLRTFKVYRTPQAERAFSRVLIMVVPVLYGPWFVHTANPGTRGQVALVSVVVVLIPCTLAILYEIGMLMECPFCKESIDTVQVAEEFKHLRSSLRRSLTDPEENPQIPCWDVDKFPDGEACWW